MRLASGCITFCVGQLEEDWRVGGYWPVGSVDLLSSRTYCV